MTEPEETIETTTVSRLTDRLFGSRLRWISALAAILGFLLAIQLLGAATDAAAPLITPILDRIVVDGGSALGLSWLVTYVLSNGSVVAALVLPLLQSGIVSPLEAFLMVAGSRLGGSAIVIFIGALDYFQESYTQSLGEGVSLGLLTFLITFTIYIPTTVLGAIVLVTFQSELAAATGGLDLPVGALQIFAPIVDTVTRTVGAGTTLIVALALLFVSLWSFDEVLERVETETVRTYVFRHFERQWMAFGIGLLITAVTTSVAFSLGVVVPLYNRRFVRREEIIPYILGANISTLLDTLVVALVLESPEGIAVVLLLSSLAALFTLLALGSYEPYAAAVTAGQDRLLSDRRFFVGFGLVLVAAPVALVLVPHL